jgi:hemoglobin
MNDIKTRLDIEFLMLDFYGKALDDKIIGFIFTEIAKINMEHHLPIIVDFWEMVLFQKGNFQEKYGRSPMLTHVQLNEKTPLKHAHFTRWLKLFHESVDKHFVGETAELAKSRAVSIGNSMLIRFANRSL